jgi:hypothetical protein
MYYRVQQNASCVCVLLAAAALSGCARSARITFLVADGLTGSPLAGVEVEHRRTSYLSYHTAQHGPFAPDGMIRNVRISGDYSHDFVFTKPGYLQALAFIAPDSREVAVYTPIRPEAESQNPTGRGSVQSLVTIKLYPKTESRP